jgi:hypothetical protein
MENYDIAGSKGRLGKVASIEIEAVNVARHAA